MVISYPILLHTLLANNKKYVIYTEKTTFLDAQEGNTLVSIGSAAEQALIETLISYTDTTDYWVGLTRRSDSGEGFDIFDWSDGSAIQVSGYGGDAVVNRIDSNGNVICEAYSNFADGEPNNANSGEKYVHLSAGGKWNDNATDYFGYITETDISIGSTNTIDYNAIFAGGLSGYNAGTIKNSYNDAKVSIYKAEAENSGISTYAGGISGYNNGAIYMVVNKGAVESFATSSSMSHHADAYAETISTTSDNGTVNDYLGIDDLSAIAISVNSLYGEYISSSVSAGTDATTTIRDYWKNSELIINSVSKADYLVSQGFDKTTLDLSYNGSSATSYTVRYNFYKEGTSTVTVMYENGSNSFTRYIPVFVASASPVSIELYSSPKVEFVHGDEFTYKGLSLKLNYNNGTYKLIPSKNVTISEPNMSLIGKQVISVSYTPDGVTYLTCNYDINISAVAMTSLQIVKTPDKTTYWQGEALDTTGLLVQKVMNNGTTEEISIGNAALTIDYDFSSVGTQTVTLTYNDFSSSFDCTVKPIEVTGIDIIGEPYKTSYVEGETLNTDGLKVQTTLSNGEVATIPANDSGLSFVYDFSTAGTQTVTVKYGNYTDSFTCEVHTHEDYLKTVTNVTVESVKGCAGNTITVDIVINNNTGILAAALNINYDSALTLIDAEGGEALSSLTLTKPGTFANPCTFAWDGINDADATNGTILTLTFVVSEEAVAGETYEISVSYAEGNVIDGSFKNVELATINGGVTVIDYVPGDLNGDGIVNMADVVNLRRYIVGGYDLTINIDAADVNNDGSVNMADVVLIRRYVVGGYGVELQ